MQRTGLFIPLMLTLLLAFAVADCRDVAPVFPSGPVPWQSYARPDIGFTLDVPAGFEAEQVGDDTVFRYQGFPVLRVLLVDAEAARTRGLWATSEPVGQAQVGGQTADVYAYDHQDLFTYTHTLAYVLPRGDKQLGIEFRTADDTLDRTEQRILDSFRFSQ